jgi:hypothetical protein
MNFDSVLSYHLAFHYTMTDAEDTPLRYESLRGGLNMGEKAKIRVSRIKRRNLNHPNPSHKNGVRNVFCPYYRECLDYAITKTWDYWACLECRFVGSRQFTEELIITNRESDLYYTLPLDIFVDMG